jgi:hypothetical protein
MALAGDGFEASMSYSAVASPEPQTGRSASKLKVPNVQRDARRRGHEHQNNPIPTLDRLQTDVMMARDRGPMTLCLEDPLSENRPDGCM